MTARDLLFKENFDLFKHSNESHTRESSNSDMVGKAKIMSYNDIQEAQRKRDKKDATGTGRRRSKRKNSTPQLEVGKKSCEEEVAQAHSEIQIDGLEAHCLSFDFEHHHVNLGFESLGSVWCSQNCQNTGSLRSSCCRQLFSHMIKASASPRKIPQRLVPHVHTGLSPRAAAP